MTQDYKTGFLDGWRAGIDEARNVIQQAMESEEMPRAGKISLDAGRLVWVAPEKGVCDGLGMA